MAAKYGNCRYCANSLHVDDTEGMCSSCRDKPKQPSGRPKFLNTMSHREREDWLNKAKSDVERGRREKQLQTLTLGKESLSKPVVEVVLGYTHR